MPAMAFENTYDETETGNVELSKVQLVELKCKKFSGAEHIKTAKAVVSRRQRRRLKMLSNNLLLLNASVTNNIRNPNFNCDTPSGTSVDTSAYTSMTLATKQTEWEKTTLIGLNSQQRPFCTAHVCGTTRRSYNAVAIPFFARSCVVGPSSSLSEITDPAMDFHYFAVFDGHAAQFCKDKLHGIIADEMMKRSIHGGEAGEWGNLMKACLEKAVDAVPCSGEPGWARSTVLIAVVGRKLLVVSSCGDSRALLVRRGGAGIQVSHQHRQHRSDEQTTIQNDGALGGCYLKPYVIAEPEVNVIKRNTEDICLILASDGLWDVLSNDLVSALAYETLSCEHVIKDLYKENSRSQHLVNLLKNCAIAKKSMNNISIIVVDLQC